MAKKPNFDHDTALFVPVLVDIAREERERRATESDAPGWFPKIAHDRMTTDQFDWFVEHCDMRLRYYYETDANMRKGLRGKGGDGRVFAVAFITHWLDAVSGMGFATYRERHPIEAITSATA